MPNEQENIDEQIIRDWVEMKKLQHPGYWTQMKDKLQIAIRQKLFYIHQMVVHSSFPRIHSR